MNLVQRKEKKAANTIATDVVRRESLKPHMSENHPSRVGEIASPSAWMKKMFTAKAIARIEGGVTLMMTVFRGPVFRNRKNSAKNMAVMQWGSDVVIRAKAAIGVPRRKPLPDTIRYPF